MTSIKVVASALIAFAAAGPVVAQESPLEPKAVEALTAMSKYLGSLQSFTMKVEDSVDKTDADGRLLTFHHNRTIDVRRPNKVSIAITGDLENDRIVYDGTLLTVVLGNDNLYAQAEAAPTIEETLDQLREKYGIRRPLTELLYSNISARVEGKLKAAQYIGLAKINGKECHHLAFHAVEGIEWQLWVENDDTPAPAKIVVHYTDFPGEPRYIMQLKELVANPQIPDSAFTFTPAEGAEKIAFEVSKQIGDKQ